VKSPSNAFGLMQLIVPTAKLVAQGTGLPWDAEALKRPEVNVALGTRLLGQLRGSFTNRSLAIAAYNAGSGAVNRWVTARGSEDFDLWVEDIPYEETRGYLKRVLSTEAAYAFLYARPALKEVLMIPPRVL
jgi:soluble lytic murein transglycosylase